MLKLGTHAWEEFTGENRGKGRCLDRRNSAYKLRAKAFSGRVRGIVFSIP